jgi:hypothetical protein
MNFNIYDVLYARSFDRHSGHPQGDVLTKNTKNTNVLTCVTITT